MRFVIVNGMPYLLHGGKTYAVRWSEDGFTVGAEVHLASVPAVTHSELAVLAKCAGRLDSIGEAEKEKGSRRVVEEPAKKPGRKKTAKAVSDNAHDG